MAGATIDHLVSVMVFLGALALFVGLFNQTIQTAIIYQRHRYLATKCSDLLDNMLLNPGYPENWGRSNCTPASFGLQDPEFTQYRLSSFSLMRLLSSAGDRVYYEKIGKWYSNVSWGFGGGYLLLQESECVNYSTASKLLGVNGTYGFQLTITPTVNINIVEDIQVTDHLRLNITVMGQGSPLTWVPIEYFIYWVRSEHELGFWRNITKADALGFACLDFDGKSGMPKIDVSGNKTAYLFVARVNLGGLRGVGYLSREITTRAGNIIPFIESYEDGIILLAHKWGKNDPGKECRGALHFNATFYVLPDNFAPIKSDVLNITGGPWLVNYGRGKPFYAVQIPPDALSEVGFLVVTYWREDEDGFEWGMVVMPWGIGTFGLSVVFGGDPSGREWVATDMRQVIVNGVAYQAKLLLWSLKGYGVIG
ncbi:hypothetical protein DRO59_01145 [Candidatus Bathyarchaeota archaeon]|nr:MAG: hypothetical protein DRO59_01145 [Candidatus Bathyarchaeota archaeon]